MAGGADLRLGLARALAGALLIGGWLALGALGREFAPRWAGGAVIVALWLAALPPAAALLAMAVGRVGYAALRGAFIAAGSVAGAMLLVSAERGSLAAAACAAVAWAGLAAAASGLVRARLAVATPDATPGATRGATPAAAWLAAVAGGCLAWALAGDVSASRAGLPLLAVALVAAGLVGAALVPAGRAMLPAHALMLPTGAAMLPAHAAMLPSCAEMLPAHASSLPSPAPASTQCPPGGPGGSPAQACPWLGGAAPLDCSVTLPPLAGSRDAGESAFAVARLGMLPMMLMLPGAGDLCGISAGSARTVVAWHLAAMLLPAGLALGWPRRRLAAAVVLSFGGMLGGLFGFLSGSLPGGLLGGPVGSRFGPLAGWPAFDGLAAASLLLAAAWSLAWASALRTAGPATHAAAPAGASKSIARRVAAAAGCPALALALGSAFAQGGPPALAWGQAAIAALGIAVPLARCLQKRTGASGSSLRWRSPGPSGKWRRSSASTASSA